MVIKLWIAAQVIVVKLFSNKAQFGLKTDASAPRARSVCVCVCVADAHMHTILYQSSHLTAAVVAPRQSADVTVIVLSWGWWGGWRGG